MSTASLGNEGGPSALVCVRCRRCVWMEWVVRRCLVAFWINEVRASGLEVVLAGGEGM